jgi:hypothetical protein
MKNLLTATVSIITVAACLSLTSQLRADEKKTEKPKVVTTKENRGGEHAYLGIGVETVNHALAWQLPSLKGRGIVIAHVDNGSPAQKAGFKDYDILVSYDKKPLHSPEQLVKLIQTDKPGREVSLEVMTAGKDEMIKVTLGAHQATANAGTQHHLPVSAGTVAFPVTGQEMNEAGWESFDAMTLSNLGNKRFKAEISYRDDHGKVEHKQFEGTRQEIRGAIEREKDLPTIEENQLLRTLDSKPRIFDFLFPQFSIRPQGTVLWDTEDLNRGSSGNTRNR